MGHCSLLYHRVSCSPKLYLVVLTIPNFDLDMGVAFGDVLDTSNNLRHIAVVDKTLMTWGRRPTAQAPVVTSRETE